VRRRRLVEFAASRDREDTFPHRDDCDVLNNFVTAVVTYVLAASLLACKILVRHSRPPLAMAQIRGTAQYNLGGQSSFGASGQQDSKGDPSPLEQIRAQTSRVEDLLDAISEPIKPYVRASSASSPLRILWPFDRWDDSRRSC
jgi:hypothetical protein